MRSTAASSSSRIDGPSVPSVLNQTQSAPDLFGLCQRLVEGQTQFRQIHSQFETVFGHLLASFTVCFAVAATSGPVPLRQISNPIVVRARDPFGMLPAAGDKARHFGAARRQADTVVPCIDAPAYRLRPVWNRAMHEPLRRHQHIPRIHLAGDDTAGRQVRIGNAPRPLMPRCLEPQIVRYQTSRWDPGITCMQPFCSVALTSGIQKLTTSVSPASSGIR